MIYHDKMQKRYEADRKRWPTLTEKERLDLCSRKAEEIGGTVHGWYDALSPKFNWGFSEKDVRRMFEEANFSEVTLTKPCKHDNINMRGKLR